MNLNSRFSDILIAVGICSNLTLNAFFSFIKNKEEPTEDKSLLVRICVS